MPLPTSTLPSNPPKPSPSTLPSAPSPPSATPASTSSPPSSGSASATAMNRLPTPGLSGLTAISNGSSHTGRMVMVMGNPALGKSTSLRNLPPEATYIINCAGKMLPFPSAARYVVDSKADGVAGNICAEIDGRKVLNIIKKLKSRPEIKYIVVDDATYTMTQEFMNKIHIDHYGKFAEMAGSMWSILRSPQHLRLDQTLIFIGHIDQTVESIQVMQTVGKLTREKLIVEGLSTVIFVPGVQRTNDEGDASYFFFTQSDGKMLARSPMGMFPYRVPNDMMRLIQRMDEYYAGVELEDSAIDLDVKIDKGRKVSSKR